MARWAGNFLATPSFITRDVLAAMRAREFHIGNTALPCQVEDRQTPRETGTGEGIHPFTPRSGAGVKRLPCLLAKAEHGPWTAAASLMFQNLNLASEVRNGPRI